jgi:adenylosuccinate synthase
MDGGAGSSGKGKLGSYIAEHHDNWQFCCNAFSAQAGHWVKLDDGRTYFYQTLNSCAYLVDKYEKMYIGSGTHMELPATLREIEENKVPKEKLGIHPLASIILDKDMAFERGEVDFEGNPLEERHDGTMKRGSTCHGVGAAKARRVLRRQDVKLAKDTPELQDYICDVEGEIIDRLDKGQAGLLEVAQGFQLSLLHRFYPYCTSRNVTVAAALNDMFIPTVYAGPLIINFRTYPIRISNKKYLDPETGRHLIWEEIEERGGEDSDKVQVYIGNSGPGYPDQEEVSWEHITESSGSPEAIMEMTSVTKLPRRAFTFSVENLKESVKFNKTGHPVYISINFANYVDYDMQGQRGGEVSDKFKTWLEESGINDAIDGLVDAPCPAELKFIGTGALTDDMIVPNGLDELVNY